MDCRPLYALGKYILIPDTSFVVDDSDLVVCLVAALDFVLCSLVAKTVVVDSYFIVWIGLAIFFHNRR